MTDSWWTPLAPPPVAIDDKALDALAACVWPRPPGRGDDLFDVYGAWREMLRQWVQNDLSLYGAAKPLDDRPARPGVQKARIDALWGAVADLCNVLHVAIKAADNLQAAVSQITGDEIETLFAIPDYDDPSNRIGPGLTTIARAVLDYPVNSFMVSTVIPPCTTMQKEIGVQVFASEGKNYDGSHLSTFGPFLESLGKFSANCRQMVADTAYLSPHCERAIFFLKDQGKRPPKHAEKSAARRLLETWGAFRKTAVSRELWEKSFSSLKGEMTKNRLAFVRRALAIVGAALNDKFISDAWRDVLKNHADNWRFNLDPVVFCGGYFVNLSEVPPGEKVDVPKWCPDFLYMAPKTKPAKIKTSPK